MTKKETLQWQSGYSPRPPTSSDQNTVWHDGWSSGSSYSFTFHQHGWAVTELWGVEIWLISLLRLMAYTTAAHTYTLQHDLHPESKKETL